MRFRILGPLELLDDEGNLVAIGGRQERVLLATLLLEANRVVSADRLIEALWGDRPPPTAANALQGHVSRLRKVLVGVSGAESGLLTEPPGYVLRTGQGELDSVHFEDLVGVTGPADGAAEVSARLAGALALWRGSVLAGLEIDPLGRTDVTRLEQLRLSTIERRVEADLTLGRHAQLVGELEGLVHVHPLREGLRAQLMLALYRSGRQADALAVYRDTHRVLKEELGIDPSPVLRGLELAILNQSSDLDLPPSPERTTVTDKRPSGTVSFLFSDIEGSTRLWERAPEAMASALKRHDELLRSAIEGSGGYVFKTAGDSFCAAFSTAKEAVQAASDAQRAIAVQSWPTKAILRVRMALHTGECEERDGDYFGPVLNRLARLESVAHGGQVVLTRATTDVVRDQLPVGVGLRALGTHRLKDLGRPEEVFQLEIEGLEADFPSLSSLDNPEFLHNLPEQASSFVGRDDELVTLCGLCGDARIVTLTGPGGVGKTRLALQVAVELLDGSGHGVWFVDLAPIEDETVVALTVANALGVREERGRPVADSLVDFLRDRDVLVVLDNCEHVIDAIATLAEQIIKNCGQVALLATSREPLGLAGEHVYRVPSLSLPAIGEGDPDRLSESEAVRLFVVRTNQHKPGFLLDVDNASMVGRLCHRLDGIPLAIELATARLRSMSLSDLEERLDQRFRILTGGFRTALPRQRTLQALVDWSYDLLSDSEQIVLCCLSVFAGGFELDAAEAVATRANVAQSEILDIVAALVDKSMIQLDEISGGSASFRYRLLETIRDYASAKLAERGEADATSVRESHRDYYLVLAEMAEPHFDGPSQIGWLDRVEREHDNLRAALLYCLSDPDPGPGLRLGTALASFWHYRGYGVEGAVRLGAHLDRAREATLLPGRALIGAGLLLAVTGDYGAAIDCGNEALAIARNAGDDRLVAEALKVFAVTHYRKGEFGEALPLIEEGLGIARLLGAEHLVGDLLSMEGVALDQTDQDGLPAYKEALDLFRRVGNGIRASSVLNNIACRELEAGDLDDAVIHLGEALDAAQQLGDRELVSYVLGNLGLASYLKGDTAAARERFVESLDMARRNGYQSQLGYALLGVALTSTGDGDLTGASTLHGFIDAFFDELGEEFQAPESVLREEDQMRLRSLLGDADFESAYSAGGALKYEDAIGIARP